MVFASLYRSGHYHAPAGAPHRPYWRTGRASHVHGCFLYPLLYHGGGGWRACHSGDACSRLRHLPIDYLEVAFHLTAHGHAPVGGNGDDDSFHYAGLRCLALLDEASTAEPTAATVTALATLLVVSVLTFRGTPFLRLWAPPIAIVVGCLVAASFGTYEIERVLQAP